MPLRLHKPKLQSGLAFGGLLLMAVCVVWLQLLPARGARRQRMTTPRARADRSRW